MKRCKLISCWTDYPITELGDQPGQTAPYRRVTVLSYDGDKYARVQVTPSVTTEIKIGYLYSSPHKLHYQYNRFWNKCVNRRKFERMVNTPQESNQ